MQQKEWCSGLKKLNHGNSHFSSVDYYVKPSRISKPRTKAGFPHSERHLVANEYMKKCSTSLATKEMQIKMTLRFYLTSVRLAIIKSINNK
jgi:hypothetical protein